jgi:translocation and assembly module TamB
MNAIRRILALGLPMVFFAWPVLPALTQNSDDTEKSGLIRYVEEQLSAPNRQIGLNRIQGTLSSDVRFESITIADENGVWLTIVNPRLQWNRTALLTGRLDIQSLTAERIEWPRMPTADDSAPAPESSGFSLPELPVSVTIGELAIPEARFGDPVFGLESVLSVDGRLSLADGSLDTEMDVSRLDGPGGQLALTATYAKASTQLSVNLSLREPDDGVVANLLNIPERPAVALTIEGAGTLEEFKADLAFDVGGERTADGNFVMAGGNFSRDRLVKLDLSGPIARILPEEHRAFFGDETALTAELLLREEGGVDIRQLQLDSGALDVTASGSTLADGFLRELAADMTLRSIDAAPVRLPLSGEPVTLENGAISLRYGTGGADSWTMAGTVSGITLPDAGIEEVRIDGSGDITGLEAPESRSVSFTFDGEADGIRPEDQAIAKAVGDAVTFDAEGNWSTGNSLRIARAAITGKTLRIAAQGLVEKLTFKGSTRIEASDLEAFSLVADRNLAGRAALDANGDIALAGGAFDLTFGGTLTDARIGNDTANRLLAGETTLSGRAARSPDGLSFRDFNIANSQVTARIDGTFATREADLRARAEFFDIATITDSGSGRLVLDAAIDKLADSTRATPFSVKAKLSLTQARLADRNVPEANIAFDGRITEGDTTGMISGNGLIDGEPIDISGDLARVGDRFSLQDFSARIGLAQMTGDIAIENSLAEGNLKIDANDIASLAALALADASGALNGTVTLSVDGAEQNASADVSASKLRYETYRIGSADIEAVIRDLTGVPQIDATIDGKAITAAGVEISALAAKASTQGNTTDFSAKATLENGTSVNTDGSVTTTSEGFSATLDTLSAQSPYGDARLTAPATISRAGDVTRIESFRATVAGGAVTASGTISDTMDIRARIAALPLSIANGFRPDLGLGGTVDATLDVSGATNNPQAVFKIDGSGIDAATLRTASISPIRISASGRYGDDAVRLDNFSATNAQNLDFSGSGTIPLSGPGLALRVNGSAPLAIGERFVVDRGTRLGGTLRIDAQLTGSLAAPNAEGLFSLTGASIADPLSNLRLSEIGGVAGLRGDTVSINRLTGRVGGGGSISISGTVGLAGARPANLDIALSNASYSDGETVRTTLSGNLSLTGPLAAGPLLSGQVDLLDTEITVPETIATGADLLEVHHIDPDGGTQRTLSRMAAVLPKQDGNAPQAPVRLDLIVSSPNRIFVRGRGIDAELGGRMRVTGPLDNPQPIGGFDLIRGRLSILNKRLQLTEGRITLTGSLDPMINLTAQVNGDDIVAYVRLRGRTSDLSLTLSASPELPQDEILARVLFGKGISSLSPLQIANLATAAASLAGGGSGVGLSEQIRQGIGVDDLDITQDKDGNVAVRAGKYVQDNIYLDVQAGQSGGEVSINLDVTDSLTAKGTVDTEGDSKLGIFFEKDY